MKKTIFSLLALLSLALTSMGQSAPEGRGGHFDKHKMAKERTERMVKEYKLNKTQAAQLLQLNEEFAQSFPMPRPGGPRHGAKKPQADGTTGATRQAPPQKPDGTTGATRHAPPQKPDGTTGATRQAPPQKPDGTTGATRQAPPQKPDSATIMPAPPERGKGAVRMNPQMMRQKMMAYDARIKQIFTKKQYKKYVAAKHHQRGFQHSRTQR